MTSSYIIRKLRHDFFAKHKKGHGIHSPSLYNFINETVFNNSSDDLYKDIESRRKFNPSKQEKKTGRLIHRIIKYLKPNILLEIRDTDNIIGNYFDQIQETNNSTRNNLSKFIININDYKLITPENSDVVFINIESDFLFFLEEPNILLSRLNNNGIILIANIHKNKKNELYWTDMIKCNIARQAIDLFYLGIIFTDPNLQKENFTIRY